MVYTGIDIVQVSRIQGIYERFGKRFEERFFAPEEIDPFRYSARFFESLSARFAAKEAFFKAYTGLWESPLFGQTFQEQQAFFPKTDASMRKSLTPKENLLSPEAAPLQKPSWKDVRVLRRWDHRPFFRFLPFWHDVFADFHWDLSLSHDGPTAVALVTVCAKNPWSASDAS